MASVLQSLAAELCLDVHLAFVRKDESGAADGYDDCCDMMEVCEEQLGISQWMRLDGSTSGLPHMDINPKEILQVSFSIHNTLSILSTRNVLIANPFCNGGAALIMSEQ